MDKKKNITDYKHSPAKRLAMKIKRKRTNISKMGEEYIVTEAATKYERKYQCPYCDERKEKLKLISHIEKRHPECIPEGYTAARIVFNIINKKQKGTCVICGKESPWNEDKGRYDRFCSDKCKKQYEEIAAERLKRVRGMTKQEMLKDPEYQNNVMLANRKISGKYKFQDGTIRTYVGSYELKFLEFMDKFLNVKSEDLETPGPIIEYKYKGETHKWITDAYYAPYNLVFDIKDGGDNPNNRNMPEYRAKQDAKEAAIKKQGKYNYLRLTDNKFEQLIELMMELKELYIENNGEYTPIVRINESVEEDSDSLNESYIINEIYDEEDDIMNENYLINKKDIYYNKDKFDSGEINLCFITGHSGSGKSTMGNDMKNKNVNVIPLDHVLDTFDLSDNDIKKEYGDIVYSFFTGKGKRFRYNSYEDCINDKYWENKDEQNGYNACLTREFIKYAMKYADTHKNEKFIIEGIWIYIFINPQELKNYAVYIKRTSMIISQIRAAKRDSKYQNGIKRGVEFVKTLFRNWKYYVTDEKIITRWIEYYSPKVNNESTILNDEGYYKLLDTYKDPKYCGWDEEQTYPTIDLCIKAEKCYGEDMYCYSLDPDTYKITYIGKLHVSELMNDEYSTEWIDKVNEACKDVETARKFVRDVGKLAKKYDANYFIVTDGASGTSNNGNPAVANARRAQIEWEKRNGFDPDEDWSKDKVNESIDTFIKTPIYEKDIILYHGTSIQDKLDIINPNSYNAGTRLSNPRMSSFWTRKMDYAKLFGLFRLIQSELKYKAIFASDFYHIYVRPSDYNNILREIKTKHIWIYKKTLNKKYVTGGHSYYIDEFTIDVPIKPDEAIKIEYNNFIDLLKDALILFPDDSKETRKRVSDNELNKMRNNKKLPKDILKILLYYNIDDVLDTVKDYKSLAETTIIKPSISKPSQEGFMGRGSWNPIKRVNGEPYRERVEAIIFNEDLTKVLISVDDKGVRIPGGGTMKNKSLESQVIKECQEEVRVNIDNIKYIGEYYLPGKMVQEDDVYKGKYTYAYLATYDSTYDGYIRPEDQSSMINSAKWYDIHEAMDLLKRYNTDIYILFCNEYKEYIASMYRLNQI